jgi:histidinol-phosphatase
VTPEGWLPLLVDLADCADAISLGYFRSRELRIEEKPDRSLVTQADLAVEESIRGVVSARYPELGIFGEEQGEQQGASGTRLIVDPIDSTANFARGIPVYATLLAIEDEGEVVAGLVSAPARLRVSRVRDLADGQLFHGSLAGGEAVQGTRRIAELIERTGRQRGFGDFYQHVLVAEGCGEIAIDPIVSPWDIGPLQVLVEEAGGRSSSTRGERTIYASSLLSSNGLLHEEVIAILDRA